MSFKVGDRVKVIDDQDGVGCQVEVGHIVRIYHVLGDPRIEVQIHSDTFVFWEHELQHIPTPLYVAEPQEELVREALTRENESELSHEEIWEAHLKYGKGEESETGSLRYNTGKPKMSLVTPDFILGMAQVLTKGAEKYGERNWELGNKTSVPYDSAMRHILAWRSGEDEDEESGCNHLFHAAVNLLMCWYYAENFSEMDDRR